MDEFDRIALLEGIFTAGDGQVDGKSSHAEVGIGDDAAVLLPASPNERRVLSVDTCVEGVHFERGFASDHDIGYRAFVAAASDLAAMGAHGDTALVSLILPSWVDDVVFKSLAEGIAEAAEASGISVVGGNLSSGDALSITTTVVGLSACPLLRSGAVPGHGVFVTGAPGERALGLRLIQDAVKDPAGAPFIESWRRPTPRIRAGIALRGVASAAIDISDGLVQDLGHLCVASRVGAQIDLATLPVSPAFRHTAATLVPVGGDPILLALYGGEDYELLYTAAMDDPVAQNIGTLIGRIVLLPPAAQSPRVSATTGPLPAGVGFDHFAG